MGRSTGRFDEAYLKRKERELETLREQLMRASRGAESEQRGVRMQSDDLPLEQEEDAQQLDLLEREDNLVARNSVRLARIQRALEKIAEGTYGRSDLSGEEISSERLDALPESIFTLQEQQADELKEQRIPAHRRAATLR